MKKLLFSMLAIAAVFATSCEKDADLGTGGETSTVSFSVGTPNIATRAYSDGMTATVLEYAVYDVNGKELTALTKEGDDALEIEGSTTVNLKLTTGNTYSVLFWAASEENPYDVDFDTKTLSVDYSKVKSNDENLDAFYKYYTFTVKGTQTETIELKRPFAQLNVGTSDYTAAANSGYEPKLSAVTVKEIYTKMNMADGSVDEADKAEVTFDFAAIPTDETFPVAGYEYLAMNYLLVSSEKSLIEVDFSYTETDAAAAKTRTVGSVPVQRNYRTNIYGQLMTSDVDINVTINPEYEDDLNKYYSWNGQADTSWYNDTDDEFELITSEELAGLAKLVDGGNDFDGKTIFLKADLDMSQFNWDPIGDNRTDAAFRGTFDGDGHTIEGLHYTGDDCWNGALFGDKRGFGLFSLVDEAVVKNVNLQKETFGSYTVITGAVAGYAYDTTFENISISETKIAGYNWYTGGVVGWAGGEMTFKGIDLAPTTVVGTLWDSHGQNAGGIAGGVSSSAKITIEDCNIACVMDVINDVTSNYKWYIYRVSGMIIGNTNTTETKYNEVVTATATNVTCKNVTVTYGDWMNYHYCEGFWNRGWGRYESSDYVGGVDQNEPHNHAAGESHLVRIPFDQLFGGSSNGSGHYPVKGLAEFPGVTVNYPESYYKSEAVEAGTLAAILTADEEDIDVVLMDDIDLPISSLGSQTPGSGEYKLGGDNTKSITIDLNGHTLNLTTTYMSAIGAKNEGVKFTIKNGKMTSSSTSGTWNIYDLTFSNCDYVIEDVVFEKSIAFENTGKSAELKNVTINETHDYYAMWIAAVGQTISIDNLTINSAGRGIKIDEQYVGTPAKVTLNIANSKIKSVNKAAIMVKSVAGAEINVSNLDITEAAADTTNAVWVDEDSAAHADKVVVTGATVIVEP